MDRVSSCVDLFISAAEPSGDLHGEKLVSALLQTRPQLKIAASSGPKMRKLAIDSLFDMEELCVMGFFDVIASLPKIGRRFFAMRKKILELNPKAVVLIDYPGFHLRLERSLRKKGYKGKLIHYISPTVWAWRKKRIKTMEQNLDLLLTIFPFEPACFNQSKLRAVYIGHPLTESIASFKPKGKFQGKILALFPGSREKEIERNLPLQLAVARRLQKEDPSLTIAISTTREIREEGVLLVGKEDTYELMSSAHLAIAKSGTVTLELALHNVPTVVTFAIKPWDQFLAKKIFRLNLPNLCIVNIILGKRAFPELFGSNFTENALYVEVKKLLQGMKECRRDCDKVRKLLGTTPAAMNGAKEIVSLLDF